MLTCLSAVSTTADNGDLSDSSVSCCETLHEVGKDFKRTLREDCFLILPESFRFRLDG